MAEKGQADPDFDITIKDDTLVCKIPMKSPDGDLTKAKMVVYGGLKIAEEQASIYFMNEQIRRRQAQASKIIRPTDAKPFTPGVV